MMEVLAPLLDKSEYQKVLYWEKLGTVCQEPEINGAPLKTDLKRTMCMGSTYTFPRPIQYTQLSEIVNKYTQYTAMDKETKCTLTKSWQWLGIAKCFFK